MHHAIERIVTEDGATLVMERREPSSKRGARAVILLSHAMMASRSSLDRPRGGGFASTLVAAGYRVLLADLRGHGEARTASTTSMTSRRAKGWSYDDLVRYDARALGQRARVLAEGLPLIAVGHSLFGHVALCARGLGLLDVDAIAVLGANTWERSKGERSNGEGPVRSSAHSARIAARTTARRALVGAAHALTRVVGYFPARALGLGSDDEPELYFRQFTRWMREGKYDSLDRRDDYAEAIARVDVPVLAVGSEGDRWLAPPSAVEDFVRRVPDHRVAILRGEGAPTHRELGCALAGAPGWRAVIEFVESLRSR